MLNYNRFYAFIFFCHLCPFNQKIFVTTNSNHNNLFRSVAGCALCLSEKDEFGPDQKWRQTVCALARQFRWTRCTSDTLFVLVEIPTTVDNAKQTCLDQAITFDGWPKAAIDDEPSVYDRRPILQLASIQDCEEIGHVNNLSQKLQNKASTFQLWFDQRSTHYHVESTSSAQALRFVRSSPPHDHTASTGQTSATPQSSVTLTSSSFSDNATAATSRLKPETANEIASTNEQLRSHYHRKHLTAEIPRLPKWFELGSSELKRSQYFWGNLFRTDGRRSRRSVTNAYRTISPYRITAQPTSDSTMNMRTGQGWNPRPHRLDQKSGITKERARSRSSAPARYNLISYHQYQADADQTLESALNPVRRSSNAKVPVVNANKEKSLHKYDSELFSRVLCADKSASPTYTMRDASNEPLT